MPIMNTKIATTSQHNTLSYLQRGLCLYEWKADYYTERIISNKIAHNEIVSHYRHTFGTR